MFAAIPLIGVDFVNQVTATNKWLMWNNIFVLTENKNHIQLVFL